MYTPSRWILCGLLIWEILILGEVPVLVHLLYSTELVGLLTKVYWKIDSSRILQLDDRTVNVPRCYSNLMNTDVALSKGLFQPSAGAFRHLELARTGARLACITGAKSSRCLQLACVRAVAHGRCLQCYWLLGDLGGSIAHVTSCVAVVQ